MKWRKIIGLVIILSGTSGFRTLEAQKALFPADSVKFLKEVVSFLGNEDRKTAKEFKESFEPVWLNEFNYAQRIQVYRISNMIIEKNFRAFPELYDFLRSVEGFKKTKQQESSFQVWINVLDKLLGQRDRRQFTDFIKMSAGLFTDGSFFENNAVKWKARSKSYRFEFDKVVMIVFDETDLVCYAKQDSMVIYKTSGTFFPTTSSWIGEKGVVTWERTGLDKSTTYAELKTYKMGMKTPVLDADSVLFYNTYFKKPLLGQLTDRAAQATKAIGVSYPRFISYSKRLFIKNVFPGVDYDGGFTLEGAKLQGAGTPDQLATLIYYRNEAVAMKASAIHFTMKEESASADKARVVIYIDNDSIFHPGIHFRYEKNTNTVSLVRQGQGINLSPFYNSYHNLEMTCEALYWKLDDPIIELGHYSELSSTSDATFASSNYFVPYLYDQVQGISQSNPIASIYQFTVRMDSLILSASKLSSFIGRPKEDLVPLYYELTIMGLLYYDDENDLVYVKPKLKDFVDARVKKKDYDPLIFRSDLKLDTMYSRHGVKNMSNASINMTTYDLLIRSVRSVPISDSQYVRVYPYDQTVIVKKNRDFVFSGVVVAGSAEFFGNGLSYEYGENKVNIPMADSMRLRVFRYGHRKGDDQVRMISNIRNVRGTIYVDFKDNKSGNKKGNNKYPYFDCIKDSYVYYNKKSLYSGVYDSSKFYFKVDPFVLDSLDNYKTAAIKLPGTFYSAGILAPMKETLSVQKDYSFGFIRKAPEGGLSLYGDKAIFKNEIRLSGKGLTADGELNFQTTFAESKDFILLPDSITGVASRYENKEKIAGAYDVPVCSGKDVWVNYVPKEKVFFTKTIDNFIKMYGDDAKFKGTIALRPGGMVTRGRTYFQKAEIKAKVMKCKAKSMDSDTADFVYRIPIEKGFIKGMETSNVKAHVDFVTRKGENISNGENSPTVFAPFQYMCYMDKSTWSLDTDEIGMESTSKSQTGDISIDTDLDLTGSNFFSIHPEQDSLNFMAPKAWVDFKKMVIKCSKVEYINVADARIYPDSNKVNIFEKARLEEFKNAKIIANNITKYHQIYQAKVSITARRKYEASGVYSYFDENNYEQKIVFNRIAPDSTFQTYAKGEVPEEQKFALSPNFEYKGKVELKAADVGLNFNGFCRLTHACKTVGNDWFSFKSVVDPKNVVIPLVEPLVNDLGNPVGIGFMLDTDTSSIMMYPAFFTSKHHPKDAEVMKATGMLVYDKDAKQYQVATEDKLKERSLPGNFVALDRNGCKLTGDGRIPFGLELGQMQVTTIGVATYQDGQLGAGVKGAMVIDFPFSDNALDKMADKINDFPDLVPLETDPSKNEYEKSLKEICGLEKSDKIIADLSLTGEVKKYPAEAAVSIYIADITLRWDPQTESFISQGPIGIANIRKNQVMKYVSGRVQIRKNAREGTDVITIYLELDETTYYYFQYTQRNGIMETVSSDSSFEPIADMKQDKRTSKGSKGVKDFEYKITTKSKAISFRNQ